MMRESDDDDDDDEEEEHDTRPPAYHEQHFNTRIEQEIGYVIEDQFLREQIAQDIYEPKPKPEFGFDPTVPGADPTNAGKPMVQFATYAANQGEFASEEDEKPTNLVASSMGYVMSKNFGDANQKDIDKEVSSKFGGGAPIDDEIEGSHRPYQALDTVDEDEEEEVEIKKSKKSQKKEKKMKQEDQNMGAAKDRIRVAVRFRPLTQEEMVSRRKKDPEQFIAWTVQDEGTFDAVVQKGVRTKTEGKNTFLVDRAYEEQDSAETIYSDMCSAITHAVVNGTHGTIFTFGPTGGGKSYTIQGGKGAKGIIQLSAKHLFDLIADDTDREYTVKASYIEIYNEQVRDLMGFEEEVDQKSRRATAVITAVNKLNVDLPVLNIREGSKGGDVHVDAQCTPVATVANVVRVLHKGNRNRATEKTETNEFSSRSHAIFRLTVESHERLDDEVELGDGGITVRVAALNIVDLAGSENAAKANTSGARKREGGKINQSLLSLTEVIRQLSLPKAKQPKFINYRDSKLTRLLQPHLSGNAAISILCCCSPSKKCLEETRATLKFAYNAKRIKLKPQINEIVDDRALIDNLKKELQEARRLLKEMREYKEKNPTAAVRAVSPTGPEFPMIERFLAHMNMSVQTMDFQDAMEELSGSSSEFDNKGGGIALSTAPSGETEITGPVEPSPPVAAAKPAEEEEDEDDIEAFRRQILAKFMNMADDEDIIEEDGGGDNEDTNINDTTVGDTTTMGDTTVNDTDYDTSMNRTFTDDTGETRESPDNAVNKENQPEPESPPAISRKDAPVIVKNAPPAAPQRESNASEVFRNKPLAVAGSLLGVDPDAASQTRVNPASSIAQNQIPVGITTQEDSYSNDTPQLPPDEGDLNLIEKFREEILEKFRDEIVDEEAAHELDENAQNVAVIANELINKFKREILFKYKDDFPEIFKKRAHVDVAATRVGDNGIVGRVIERDALGVGSSDGGRLNTDESSGGGSVEQFEDEFDDEAELGRAGDDDAATADAPPRERHVPARSYSTQTDRAVINGKALLAGVMTSKAELDATDLPINSSVGRGVSGSVSSDLSSDVADKDKEDSGISPVPAKPPDDEDDDDDDDDGEYMKPPGEIAVNTSHPVSGAEGKLRIKFLEEKLLATDELVETLFVELENAKSFIRELMFESTRTGRDATGAGLFGTGTSGVTVVDEQILNQCEILKFAIYASLLFFVFGQHELFLATVFFLWLSLEVATKT